MSSAQGSQRTQRTQRFFWLVSFVSFVSSVFHAAVAPAQMTGAPTAGYRAAPGLSASTMPAPLREIGFDQNLDRPLPLDTKFLDEHGREVRVGEYFGSRISLAPCADMNAVTENGMP